jgi:hypothetical protein
VLSGPATDGTAAAGFHRFGSLEGEGISWLKNGASNVFLRDLAAGPRTQATPSAAMATWLPSGRRAAVRVATLTVKNPYVTPITVEEK